MNGRPSRSYVERQIAEYARLSEHSNWTRISSFRGHAVKPRNQRRSGGGWGPSADHHRTNTCSSKLNPAVPVWGLARWTQELE